MTQTAATQPGDLPTNWGRWGPDDERGTLNFVTEQARRRGVEQARTGRVVSLAVPVTPVVLAGGRAGQPGMAMMPAPILQMLSFTGSPAVASVDVLIVNTHHAAMTHIDTLAHVAIDGEVYPGVPLDVATVGGTIRHGSTTAFAAGIATCGVLLDLAPASRLEPGHVVTPDDLENAEQRSRVRVESGMRSSFAADARLLRTSWSPCHGSASKP